MDNVQDPQQLSFLETPRYQTALVDGNWAVYDNLNNRVVEWCANCPTAQFLAQQANNKYECLVRS